MSQQSEFRTTLVILLTGLFTTSLISAQFLGSKLGMFMLPVIGAVSYPTGTLAYAGTFFATDLTSEVLGKRTARKLVNIGFGLNFVMLGLAWLAIIAPRAGGVSQEMFSTVIGSSTNIVLGSLLAYVVSQNWDVGAFHFLGQLTDGEHLWLRNVGSTGTSQLIDTVLFTVVAFVIAPTLLGIGPELPTAVVLQTILGQYTLKLLIALVDTPLVYAAVVVIRQRTTIEFATPRAS